MTKPLHLTVAGAMTLAELRTMTLTVAMAMTVALG